MLILSLHGLYIVEVIKAKLCSKNSFNTGYFYRMFHFLCNTDQWVGQLYECILVMLETVTGEKMKDTSI